MNGGIDYDRDKYGTYETIYYSISPRTCYLCNDRTIHLLRRVMDMLMGYSYYDGLSTFMEQ